MKFTYTIFNERGYPLFTDFQNFIHYSDKTAEADGRLAEVSDLGNK